MSKSKSKSRTNSEDRFVVIMAWAVVNVSGR